MLLELSSQKIVVSGLSSEAVPVLRKHHRDAASGDEIAHLVHTRSLHTRSALTRVRDLCEDLVLLAGRILPQRFHLLGQGVATPRLLIGGYAGVENRPLRAVTIDVRHVYSPTISAGFTSRALASLRSVLIRGSALSNSIRFKALLDRPALSANSC